MPRGDAAIFDAGAKHGRFTGSGPDEDHESSALAGAGGAVAGSGAGSGCASTASWGQHTEACMLGSIDVHSATACASGAAAPWTPPTAPGGRNSQARRPHCAWGASAPRRSAHRRHPAVAAATKGAASSAAPAAGSAETDHPQGAAAASSGAAHGLPVAATQGAPTPQTHLVPARQRGPAQAPAATGAWPATRCPSRAANSLDTQTHAACAAPTARWARTARVARAPQTGPRPGHRPTS